MKATDKVREAMLRRGYLCPTDAAELTGLHDTTLRIFARQPGNAAKHAGIWWIRLDRLRAVYPLAEFPGHETVTPFEPERFIRDEGENDSDKDR